MPDVMELGNKVKAKYPGAYDDIPSDELGRKIKAKYPGSYDDFADVLTGSQQQQHGRTDLTESDYYAAHPEQTPLGFAQRTMSSMLSPVLHPIDTIKSLGEAWQHPMNALHAFDPDTISTNLTSDDLGQRADQIGQLAQQAILGKMLPNPVRSLQEQGSVIKPSAADISGTAAKGAWKATKAVAPPVAGYAIGQGLDMIHPALGSVGRELGTAAGLSMSSPIRSMAKSMIRQWLGVPEEAPKPVSFPPLKPSTRIRLDPVDYTNTIQPIKPSPRMAPAPDVQPVAPPPLKSSPRMAAQQPVDYTETIPPVTPSTRVAAQPVEPIDYTNTIQPIKPMLRNTVPASAPVVAPPPLKPMLRNVKPASETATSTPDIQPVGGGGGKGTGGGNAGGNADLLNPGHSTVTGVDQVVHNKIQNIGQYFAKKGMSSADVAALEPGKLREHLDAAIEHGKSKQLAYPNRQQR